ncbi:MAG: leucine-rich repeat domain-containing protein, partial [Candidatus Thorarchaeota archaeon]|nr:leucine-rich repeat domain-containing protein [Candidatus Thorarchaeota archaeon]
SMSRFPPFNALRWFYVHHNQLEGLDLSALSSCASLEYLVLSNNRLRQLDLTPLIKCSEMRYLLLNDNELKMLDVSPLFHLYRLEAFSVDDETQLVAESRLRCIQDPPLPLASRLARIEWQ